jgi:two-component system NtrC family sensor kinase
LNEEIDTRQNNLDQETIDNLKDLLTDLKLNLKKINQHGRRADGIVEIMMEHARITGGPRRPIQINTLLDEYVNLTYQNMQTEQPPFEVNIDRDYDPILADIVATPQDIGRVFRNLLNNAFYALREKAERASPDYLPTLRLQTRQVEHAIEICIEDNGSGVNENLRGKIFEPFFTTKPAGKGSTGLGLSLSYDIITQGHGGNLQLASNTKEGATFVMTLPLNPDASPS